MTKKAKPSVEHRDGLCMLVHAEEGMGKSWFGQSTPVPRLVLDAEGGSRKPWRSVDGVGVRQRRLHPKQVADWDPRTEEPPEWDGSWDVCRVGVRKFDDISAAYGWLNAGVHPFKSVVLDSYTEIQKRCKDAISGTETPTERDWGLLLIRMDDLARKFRDLITHPENPLEAVIFLALTIEKNGKRKPAVQGAAATSLPGYVDVEGYLYVKVDEDENEERRLLIVPRDGFAAKDRTHVLSQHYGPAVPSPDVEQMLAVYNEEEQ